MVLRWSRPFSLLLSSLSCLCLWVGLLTFSTVALPTPAIAAPEVTDSSTQPLSDKEIISYLDDLKQRAFATANAGQYDEAIINWTELIDYFSDQAEVWSNRGNVYAAQNKMELAIADYDKAVELAPEAVDPLVNRGVAWEVLREWDKAIADYNRALKINPDDPVAHNNRGNAQAGKGNWYGAIADYSQATILDPKLAFAKANYALALYETGEHDLSIKTMRQIVQRYPRFADVRAALTAALWLEGKSGEAESNWFAVEGLDRRYKDIEWVTNIRRWPPSLVEGLKSFLTLQ